MEAAGFSKGITNVTTAGGVDDFPVTAEQEHKSLVSHRVSERLKLDVRIRCFFFILTF